MNAVTLKNGSKEASAAVAATMMSLNALVRDAPIVFYEMVQLCRDPGHEVWSSSILQDLMALSLVGSDGRVHSTVRNVVLSAVSGDGLNMRLAVPVA